MQALQDYIQKLMAEKGLSKSALVEKCRGAEVLDVSEMESNEEVWADWLKQENEYAVNDRKAMLAGGGKYLNFIRILLKKK